MSTETLYLSLKTDSESRQLVMHSRSLCDDDDDDDDDDTEEEAAEIHHLHRSGREAAFLRVGLRSPRTFIPLRG